MTNPLDFLKEDNGGMSSLRVVMVTGIVMILFPRCYVAIQTLAVPDLTMWDVAAIGALITGKVIQKDKEETTSSEEKVEVKA